MKFLPIAINTKILIRWIICVDVLMVLLHLTLGPHFAFFNVDVEQNLPTVVQSSKLILAGIYFALIALFVKLPQKSRRFLLPLGLFSVALGFDELLQIHENIYRVFEYVDWFHPSRIVTASLSMGYRSSLWLLYYLPAIIIFVFWGGYWVRSLQETLASQSKIIAICAGSLFLILLTEVLSSTGQFSDQTYFWMVTLEEAAEMAFATALIWLGFAVLESKKTKQNEEQNGQHSN